MSAPKSSIILEVHLCESHGNLTTEIAVWATEEQSQHSTSSPQASPVKHQQHLEPKFTNLPADTGAMSNVHLWRNFVAQTSALLDCKICGCREYYRLVNFYSQGFYWGIPCRSCLLYSVQTASDTRSQRMESWQKLCKQRIMISREVLEEVRV